MDVLFQSHILLENELILSYRFGTSKTRLNPPNRTIKNDSNLEDQSNQPISDQFDATVFNQIVNLKDVDNWPCINVISYSYNPMKIKFEIHGFFRKFIFQVSKYKIICNC